MLNSYSIAISESNGPQSTRNTRQRTDTTVPLSGAGNGSNPATSSMTTTGSPSMADVLAAGRKCAVSAAADGTVVGGNVPRMRTSKN